MFKGERKGLYVPNSELFNVFLFIIHALVLGMVTHVCSVISAFLKLWQEDFEFLSSLGN